ncbi:C-type lectin domain family 17, member A-like [Mobula hypostoma]|uniref:C-type lectin domain family 17, member A-like n=1 Tax=Mobula hypostoma TaxID=723540 RepID=UPI002FC31BB3
MKDSTGKEEIKMNVKSGGEDAQPVRRQEAPGGDPTKGTAGAAAGKSFSIVSYILLALFVLLMVMFVVEMLKFRQISSEIKDLKDDMTKKLARVKEELITETQKGHGQLVQGQVQGQRKIESGISDLKEQMRKWHGDLRAQIADMKNNCRPRFECPKQWTLFGQKCYYFSSNMEDWKSSQTLCSSQMANLVVIDRSDKQEFIKNEIRAPPYWIGLRNSSSDRAWLWVDGTDYPSSKKFWSSDEPRSIANSETCATTNLDGKWVVRSCSERINFICERPVFCHFK